MTSKELLEFMRFKFGVTETYKTGKKDREKRGVCRGIK